MLSPDTCSRCAAVLRVIFHLLTLGTAFSWIRFAELRSLSLDRPSIHHRVWLRVLITLSATAQSVYLLSLWLDWCGRGG